MKRNMVSDICKTKHDPIHLLLRTNGRLIVCRACKKVLLAPRDCALTESDIEIIIEFANVVAEHAEKKKR